MSMRCSYAGAVCLWDRNPAEAKEVRFMGVYDRVYAQVYGVIPAGRGVPEGGIDSLKIGKKIDISASLCGPGGKICRIWPFLSFRQVKNCRLGKFLSFRQFWDRRQYGPENERTPPSVGKAAPAGASVGGCVRSATGSAAGSAAGCFICRIGKIKNRCKLAT